MAQLKDTLVSGDLRVTDILYSDTVQADTINAKTSSSATTYGPGTSGQVLKSNGTFSYWDASDDTKVTQTLDDSTNSAFQVLLANTAYSTNSGATLTESAKKTTALIFNPNTSALKIKNNSANFLFQSSSDTKAGMAFTSTATNMDFGWDYSSGAGALGYFRGSSYATTDDQGAFGLRARKDTSGYKELKGTTDGTLKWTGDNLRINNDNVGISITNANKNMDFGWAWTGNKGAGAYFRAADYSSGDNQGQFGFFARNASATKQLIGSVSGALTWDGNSIYHAGNLPDQLKVPRVDTDANSDITAPNTLVVKEHIETCDNLPVPSKFWHIYSAQGTDENYQTQLALGMTTDKPSLFTRQKKNGTWRNWTELCTSATGPIPMFSNTYSGLIGSANTAADASFYFGHIIPTDYYDVCKIHFRLYVTCAGTDSAAKSARSMHDCWLEISWNALRTYSIFNSFSSTDYRPLYYINIYRANNTGIGAGYGHLIGAGLRSSWNRTTAANSRTIRVDILETVNCTYTPFENALKYANVPGTGSTNYSGLTEANGYSQGLQESGDSNTYDRIRYQQNIKAGSTAIAAGNIIVADSNGSYTHLKLGNAFDINYPILYANAAISANSTGNDNYLILPFAIATTQSITLTAYKPVYIKGTLSGTTFTPVSTTPLTQTVPYASDGYQYMLLGVAYSTTAIYLISEHKIFAYQNESFCEYTAEKSKITYSMTISGSPYTIFKIGKLSFGPRSDDDDYWKIKINMDVVLETTIDNTSISMLMQKHEISISGYGTSWDSATSNTVYTQIKVYNMIGGSTTQTGMIEYIGIGNDGTDFYSIFIILPDTIAGNIRLKMTPVEKENVDLSINSNYTTLDLPTLSSYSYMKYASLMFKGYQDDSTGFWSRWIQSAVGATSTTINNFIITPDSAIEAYTNNSSGTPVNYTSIVTSDKSVAIYHPALTEATKFRVLIKNFVN